MDEEGYSNGPLSDISSGRGEKVDGPLVAASKPSDTETTVVDKPQASIHVKPSTVSEMNKITDQGKSEVPKAAAAPIFGFGDKSPLQKELITSAPTFAFANKVTTPTNKQNAVSDVASEGKVAPIQQAPVPTTFKFGDPFPIPANAATENGNKNSGSPFKFSSPIVDEKESAKVGSASVFKAESSFRSVCLFPLLAWTRSMFVLYVLLSMLGYFSIISLCEMHDRWTLNDHYFNSVLKMLHWF